MSGRSIALVIALTGTGACGPASQTMPRPDPDLPPPVAMRGDLDAAGRGRIVFENACAGCHGIDSPGESAPDMRVVARRYAMEFRTEAAVANHVAAWIGAPSEDRMLLPAAAAEHQGLMRRLALDPDLALDVGHYVWSLAVPDTIAMAVR